MIHQFILKETYLNSWLHSLYKVLLITATTCLLVFSTSSCTNTQINSSQIEVTSTPTQTPILSPTQLPSNIQSAVLNNAVKQISKPAAALRITKVQKQSWGNSCLGLPKSDEVCAQIITPGWKVIVNDGTREWIYRTDKSGKRVRLEDLQG